MKILHLPSNIATQLSISVKALRGIGIDARGLAFGNSKILDNDGLKTFSPRSPSKQMIPWLKQNYEVISAIRWADVIHWHGGYSDSNLHFYLKCIYFFNKPALVEFWGSEIRIAEIASQDNPYLKKMLADPKNNYDISYEHSFKTQENFASHGFKCIIPGCEMPPYVIPDLFSSFYKTDTRVIVSDFKPMYPDPKKNRPVVVHAPSSLALKGTSFVLKAVEQLQTQYDFEFKLIHDVSHKDALAMVQGCDIMLDQFILGSFGAAALEAMAFGKPTICYVKPSLLPDLPDDFPIINANPDNLAEVLGSLLTNGQHRQNIGKKSRQYVENHHDAKKIAKQLVRIYSKVLGKDSEKTVNERDDDL